MAKLILFISFMILSLNRCSLEEGPVREIRGHTLTFEGVAHGTGAVKGERYCHLCHGLNLVGGETEEPSCYRCHGENWQKTGADGTNAPSDHTLTMGGFHHHPNALSPLGTCASSGCHGDNLEGDPSVNTPTCYLCHDQKWP